MNDLSAEKIILGAFLVLVEPLVRGFVIMKLWAWFVATALRIHSISFPEAVGLSIFWYALSRMSIPDDATSSSNKPVTEDVVVSAFTRVLFMPSAVLGVGWLWHSFAIPT